jgi:hypothetical protein
MAQLSIVEHFDVLKDRQLRLLARLIGMPVRPLAAFRELKKDSMAAWS